MVLRSDEVPPQEGDCPVCGGYREVMTAIPINSFGTCPMFLVCEECGHETELDSKDSVL